jgi:hypothetical protein
LGTIAFVHPQALYYSQSTRRPACPAPQLKRDPLGRHERQSMTVSCWVATPLAIAVAEALCIASCTAQGSVPPHTYVLTQLDGRPLPYSDSGGLGPRRQLLNRIERGTLRFSSGDRLVITTINRPPLLAHIPCELLRTQPPGDQNASGELVRISDTSTAGCDDLRIEASTVSVSYRRIQDSLFLRTPDIIHASGAIRGDTIFMRFLDTSLQSPRLATYVRQ